ncbi:hypothetical protein LCGC14_2245170, partial [marine sediment metagenome]
MTGNIVKGIDHSHVSLPYLSITVIVFFLIYCTYSCEKFEPKRIVAVQTGQAIEVMATTALVNGEIIDVGEGIDQYGHCWGLTANPTLEDSKTYLHLSYAKGIFTSGLEELEPGTTYHVRAYAVSGEAVYGKDQTFTTQDGKAIISLNEITNITLYSAQGVGIILSVNGDLVMGRGVCWDTVQLFKINDCLGYTSDSLGLGEFTFEITSLFPGKTYYVRAYAYSRIDTSYSNTVNFTTRDGIATLTTPKATDITATSAVSGGNITEDGGASIITRGVCWNSTGSPNLLNNDGITADGSGTGSY